jgi:hypothetical protein
MDPIPWKRVQRALSHYARIHKVDSAHVGRVFDLLSDLVGLCGQFSRSRQTARNIGITLLRREQPHLIVPVCPAYTHEDGLYDYKGVGEGVPLLASAHKSFLQKVQDLLPGSRVMFLLADQEALVPELCEAIGVDSKTFINRVRRSLAATKRFAQSFGWDAEAMTRFVPGVINDVPLLAEELLTNDQYRRHLAAETDRRAGIYARIGFPNDVFFERTVTVAAAYTHLGWFAHRHRYLIVNHTTPNLSWFRRAGVGFLHNDIRVYEQADRQAV